MLDLDTVRNDPRRVKEALRAKDIGSPDLVDTLLEVDETRRSAITELQDVQSRQNELSQQIGALKREGKDEEAEAIIEKTGRMKEKINRLKEEVQEAEARQEELVLELPNIPHPSVPVGADEDDNEVEETIGGPPAFDFDPAPHWELADRHNLVDLERGAKVAGSGFPFYLGKGARLQRALLNFFLDRARERGYTEMQAPLFVNPESAKGTGQLPDKDALMYEIPRDDFYPIPTAEVPVTNFHRDEILAADDLPRRYCTYSPCWRREAGSYGSDVRGLNRLHQFDKVELVRIVPPDESYRALDALLEDAESALDALDLPYRRLLMCTGDMGFTQAKVYDLEVWSAAQERWLEVSSVSNFEAFQARRAQIRYRPEPEAKPELVHTLNGSGLAFPRIVAALLENNQQPDGSIELPEALHPYTGFARIGAEA
ncbi:serine--tRNA ligase [Salinibacter ruber]|uniref:Serine--tRNA ligase n=1 Tax=Salinibacter ruber TaxID=146919 RepID=A0A9X2UM96_9BACT|nr:serine--tRNA ligase [Salinibacter ruber]MCS3612067.1 seryl-tRNA synthetase [Salinibacter ruber]MCS3615636.1 seryl-tRNA synthetase [Salinibacter ruber]MCS3646574.1 seryl-tRNA synthetase [Salinibacter ruber]MCS3674147.1 seryl-tRNA synthetase [Salinibacter ruber]MCS3783930.1 seryl-tRNA synthetase [Salinibacter ruber]